MEVQYKGHTATITVEVTDFSDICFGLQHNITIKLRAPHIRCVETSITQEEYDALGIIAQQMLVRAVDSKTKKKVGRPRKKL